MDQTSALKKGKSWTIKATFSKSKTEKLGR